VGLLLDQGPAREPGAGGLTASQPIEVATADISLLLITSMLLIALLCKAANKKTLRKQSVFITLFLLAVATCPDLAVAKSGQCFAGK
jgi:hypothetical protein